MSPVRVLVAPDRYAALLTSPAAAQALAVGWSEGAGHDLVVARALTDGGPGFLDVLAAASVPGEGHTEPVLVHDPWGRPIPATVLVRERAGERTAYLEAAQVCGAQLWRPGDDLALATTAGLGELMGAAIDAGATRLVVGLGGACVPDAGLGVAAGLGGDPGVLGAGAAALAQLTAAELAPLEWARHRLRGIPVTALGELDRPLLGLLGVAATQIPDPALGQRIESALGHAVAVVRAELGEPADLLTGTPVRVDRLPGAAAGCGLGFGLRLLGAQILDGAAEGLVQVGLVAELAMADLVVTGTAVLGAECLRGSPVTALSVAAGEHGIPVVAVVGRVEAGRRETMAAGLSGTYAVAQTLAGWPAFAASPVPALARRAAAVARTWSPAGRD